MVKQEKGITMTSLIIYILAMMIIIGIVATITSFFYTNVGNLDSNSQNVSEITKFNMYFIEEIEQKENTVLSITPDKNKISFSSGNTFSFQDKAIYLNSIRICENVTNFQVETQTQNTKEIITVLISAGDKIEYTKVTQYVMKHEI